jgi:hypothetical protein
MIDPDLIISHPQRLLIEQALATLAESEIFEMQKQRHFTRTASSADSITDEELATSIKEYRQKIRALDSLQQLGKSFVKEQDHE